MTTSASHRYIDVATRTPGGWQRGTHHPVPSIGGRYDQFIAAARYVFPGLALALILVTASWLVFNPQESSFVLSRERVDISSERLRMEKPRYFGTDKSGRPFVVEAQSALQEKGETELVSLTGIEAELVLADGTDLLAKANRGVFFMSAKRLALVGDVDVEASNGYRVRTSDAELDLANHVASGARPVTGKGPLGYFEAKGFHAEIDQGLIVFDGGVKTRITPTRQTPPAPAANQGTP